MYTKDLDGRLLMPDFPDDKQATTAFKHNIQRFQTIFDGVFKSIALLKPNGNLIEVNLISSPTAVTRIDSPLERLLVVSGVVGVGVGTACRRHSVSLA